MSDLASLHAIVRGHVQGVFFRAFVESRAQSLGISGYVRNRPAGTVEVRAEGEKLKLETLVEHLKKGPPSSSVEDVAVKWGEFSGEFTGFRIR
jgi:acylphosphatase